eukprot:358110-Prymnesium_polylepis.1
MRCPRLSGGDGEAAALVAAASKVSLMGYRPPRCSSAPPRCSHHGRSTSACSMAGRLVVRVASMWRTVMSLSTQWPYSCTPRRA